MKTKPMLAGILLAVLMLFGAQGPIASASTLQEIQTKQESKQRELNELNRQVGTALTEVNELNDQLNALQSEITEKEEEISNTEADIVIQEKVVADRVEQAKARLLSIQKTELNQNVIMSILEAESVSDLINRAYVLLTLQGASNEQMDGAFEEQEKLAALESKLTDEKADLVAKTDEAQSQKTTLDQKVASLQTLIQDNQAELAQLNQEREAEVARIAEEKRKAQAAAVAAAQQRKAESQKNNVSSSETVVASVKSEKTEAPKKKQPAATQPSESKPAAPQASAGKTISVSATGYSTKQPGLSTHTATGIDLRVNPRVIAVDPRVIPLGSMIEIPGLGIFIAGDTGGAIKGNKIDIHFSTVGQALNWGRRTITIRILN